MLIFELKIENNLGPRLAQCLWVRADPRLGLPSDSCLCLGQRLDQVHNAARAEKPPMLRGSHDLRGGLTIVALHSRSPSAAFDWPLASRSPFALAHYAAHQGAAPRTLGCLVPCLRRS